MAYTPTPLYQACAREADLLLTKHVENGACFKAGKISSPQFAFYFFTHVFRGGHKKDQGYSLGVTPRFSLPGLSHLHDSVYLVDKGL